MDTYKEFIANLLRESGKLVMSYYGSAIETSQKAEPSQVVTKVDLASERLITAKISEHFSQHSIIAEESGFIDKKSEYIWIIDPIDGTSNFAKGLPWFGIMIALLHNVEPVAAGIYLPVTNELYVAEKEKGTYRNGIQVAVPQTVSLKDSLIAFHFDPTTNIHEQEVLTKIFTSLVPSVRNLRTTNSAVDYAYVAEGKLGGLIGCAGKIWDVAPIALLAKEAGCIVTDHSGSPLDLAVTADTMMKNFAVVIGSQTIHKQLLNFIPRSASSS